MYIENKILRFVASVFVGILLVGFCVGLFAFTYDIPFLKLLNLPAAIFIALFISLFAWWSFSEKPKSEKEKQELSIVQTFPKGHYL